MSATVVQDGIRSAEDQRRQRRPGHADGVGEDQQLADVIQGVAQPPFGQRHQGLRPPLDQVAQLQLRQPSSSPEDRDDRRKVDPSQRRLNSDVVPLAMRIMDESATVEEYHVLAERLAAMARRLQNRAAHVGLVIDGEVAVAADRNVTGSADMVHYRDL